MRQACGYCGNHNEGEDSRCQLCGRRLAGQGLTLVPESHGSAAPNLDPAPEPPVKTNPKHPVQARLFPVQEPKKVIPFDRVSPEATTAGRKVIEKNAKARALRRANERMGVTDTTDQQIFPFPAEQNEARKAEPLRYTEAPVAGPSHRAMAAAYDIAMILMGFGLFLSIHYFGGASFGWSSWNLWTYGGVGVTLALFYYSLFALGNGDTPGMKAVRIRLLDLEGHAPTRKQRFLRIIGTLVSLSALGIGLLWCLFDEEQLTWQDEISGTFPSPRLAE